ncbi:TPA: hypothetical protein EYP45_00190 [Candidatus Peregrinibacteria bacterium]|nr:hypothetical protein [Candidatus Peregrinibacteria bacterium]
MTSSILLNKNMATTRVRPYKSFTNFMKKLLLSVFATSTFFISSAFAVPEIISQQEEEPIKIKQNISDDAYIAGEEITVNAKISGDAIIAGMNITLEKDVTEDALLAGHTIIINGNIKDDIRAAGHNITINGNVGDDIIAAGKNIIIRNSKIGGSVIVTAKHVKLINITANEGIKITAETIFFDSTVSGLVSLTAKNITFGKNAHITGSLIYSGHIKGVYSDETLKNIVNGNITKKESEFSQYPILEDKRIFIAGSLFSIIFFSFLLTIFIPKYFSKSVSHILSAPFSRFISGLIWFLGAPILALLLLLTAIGLPFGITLIALWGLSFLLLPYFCTSILSSLFLRLFKWEGFFATFVVTILSAIISITPLLLLFAPFILGGMLKEKSEILKSYKK